MTSSWISSILYKRLPDGSSYLGVFVAPSNQPICAGERIPVAMLYGGPTNPIPPWLPGLLHAGTGKRSPGLAYNRLLKGKYPYQRVEGSQAISELRRMLS